jgi:hypothetical protein
MSIEDRAQQFRFCPCCFADEASGSWHHVVVSGYCTNCGNGSTVLLPRWAIDSIREQASWVGKRYYPHKEDAERHAERDALLALVTRFPGRTATPAEGMDADQWSVRQEMPGGLSVTTLVRAETAEEAMRKCRLCYVPEPSAP